MHEMYLTLSIPKFVNLMLIISVVGIAGVKKIELGIAKFVLSDARFEVGSITSNKAGSFVNNI